jgi:hypothetical protein
MTKSILSYAMIELRNSLSNELSILAVHLSHLEMHHR